MGRGRLPAPAARDAPSLPGVRLDLPDGSRAFATHGDLVGRLASAAVHVDDPAISEAHALVSLRGGGFRLLALRGALAVDGAQVDDVLLVPGRVVQLAPALVLTVREVALPGAVLAIEAEGLPRQALPATAALTTRPSPRLWPRFRADAAAWIWWNGAEWSLRVAGSVTRPLRADEDLEVDGQRFRTTLVHLDGTGGEATVGPGLDLEPLTIEARFDVVHVRRGEHLAVTLTGKPARLVAEVVSLGGEAEWELLAREVWGEGDRIQLRKKLDVCLVRLRHKLRRARVRPNLLRALGTGIISLSLHPRDRVIDAS